MKPEPILAGLLQGFFTERLMQQRRVSPHTIASYRDAFRLLLQFAAKRVGKPPSALALQQIDAPLVVAFLDELEAARKVGARTRNLRLTAIHSFCHYASFEATSHAAQLQRILAIPAKRFTRTLVPFLSRAEVDALLATPDRHRWSPTGRQESTALPTELPESRRRRGAKRLMKVARRGPCEIASVM